MINWPWPWHKAHFGQNMFMHWLNNIEKTNIIAWKSYYVQKNLRWRREDQANKIAYAKGWSAWRTSFAKLDSNKTKSRKEMKNHLQIWQIGKHTFAISCLASFSLHRITRALFPASRISASTHPPSSSVAAWSWTLAPLSPWLPASSNSWNNF